MTRIITCYNKKGGSCKTITTQCMAMILASRGYRVLVIDADPQRNTTRTFGLKEGNLDLKVVINTNFNGMFEQSIQHTKYENVDGIPSNPYLESAREDLKRYKHQFFKNNIEPIKDRYDFIFIDLNNRYQEMLEDTLCAATDLIVTTNSSADAVMGFFESCNTIKECKKENPNLRLAGFLNGDWKSAEKVNIREINKLSGVAAEVNNSKVFSTTVRHSASAGKANTQGVPVYAYDKNCSTIQDYEAIVDEYLNDLNAVGIAIHPIQREEGN